MPKLYIGSDVFSVALARMEELYKRGHEVVVACSGGKDSTVCVELAVLAARNTGRLPAKIQFVDEEILLPGTHDYLMRLAQRTKEIDMTWAIANQPNPNPFNREQPYWFAFDPDVPPEDWVSLPPSFASFLKEKDLFDAINTESYPVDASKGQALVSVVGIRTQESPKRAMALATMRANDLNFAMGTISVPGKAGAAWPIYDWQLGDVWKAVKDNGWDYNTAYDVMLKMGVKPHRMRIGPAIFNGSSITQMKWAAGAWPVWFDKCCNRIPGLRTAVKFGKYAFEPFRKSDETWERCYQRVNIDEAPEWIRERAIILRDNVLRRHARHSTTPFPEEAPCRQCAMGPSWHKITVEMFTGDVFGDLGLPYMPPSYFKPNYGPYGLKEKRKFEAAQQLRIKLLA